MTLLELSPFRLTYLATPYSLYPHGIGLAFREAAKLAARLMVGGVKVFSPITHGHSMSVYGKVAPLNHELWLDYDRAFMEVCDALVVGKLESWEKSFGIAQEIKFFTEAKKPIYYIDPATLEVSAAAA